MRSWLLRPHIIAALLAIAAIAAFVEGSAMFERMAHSGPDEGRLRREISGRLPLEFAGFEVRHVSTHGSRERSARTELVLREPLYERVPLEEAARARGDDPEAFTGAMARFDGTSSPAAVFSQWESREVYQRARSAGAILVLDLPYSAAKEERGWSLLDCYRRWTQPPEWHIANIPFPPLPPEFAGLRRRGELDRDAVVSDEPEGERLLQSYIDARREMAAKAVKERAAGLDRAVAAAVERELAGTLPTKDGFTLALGREEAIAPVEEGAVLFRVSVTQEVDLFRVATPDAKERLGTSTADAFVAAQRAVDDFMLEVAGVPPMDPAFVELASPAGREYTGRVRVLCRPVAAGWQVDGLEWLERLASPGADLLRAERVPAGAVFGPEIADRYTLAQYERDIEEYTARVQRAVSDRERRWGRDQRAWRLIAKAVKAHGGPAAFERVQSWEERISGSGRTFDGRTAEFNGVRRVSVPDGVREDLGVQGRTFRFALTEAIVCASCWRIVDGQMSPDVLPRNEEVRSKQQLVYATYLLHRLTSPEGGVFVLSASSDAAQVSVAAEGRPDIMLHFEPTLGLLNGLSYREVGEKNTREVEMRFSDFRAFDGLQRPGTTTVLVDGKVVRAEKVESAHLIAFDRDYFRHPNDPGRPFAGRPEARRYSVTIQNAHPRAVVAAVFDDGSCVAPLASGESRRIQLQEGEHVATLLVWIRLIDMARQRAYWEFDSRSARLSLSRDSEWVIQAHENAAAGVAWRFP